MKFFVDTADIDAIRDLAALGIVDGVTTNPSLIMKSGRDIKEVIAEIAEIAEQLLPTTRRPLRSPRFKIVSFCAGVLTTDAPGSSNRLPGAQAR